MDWLIDWLHETQTLFGCCGDDWELWSHRNELAAVKWNETARQSLTHTRRQELILFDMLFMCLSNVSTEPDFRDTLWPLFFKNIFLTPEC